MTEFSMEEYQHIELLAGVDEVGRGPLVGNVVTAAVILPKHHQIKGLTDSKALSEKKRNGLVDIIKDQAVSWALGRATPAEIDELNILQATFLAMQRAVDGLSVKPEMVLVDGNKLPKWSFPSRAIVKGDSLVEAISAASILAKVARDEEMIQLDQQYPDYGFAKHKGYPTKYHMQLLQQLGPIAQYRKSFKPVKQWLEENDKG